MATQTSSPVSNFVFRSDCWNGGYEGVGALFTGQFVNSYLYASYSGGAGAPQLNLSPGSSNLVVSKGGLAAGMEWPPPCGVELVLVALLDA